MYKRICVRGFTDCCVVFPWLLVVFVLIGFPNWCLALDTTDDAEGWIKDLLNDIEFGLGSYSSVSEVSIETSPDSKNWVQSKARFSQFYDEKKKLRIDKAEWSTRSLGDDYRADPSETLATGNCQVILVTLDRDKYAFRPEIEQGFISDISWETCGFVDPFGWIMMIPICLKKDANIYCQRDAVIFALNAECVSTEATVGNVQKTRWVGKEKLPNGKVMAFHDLGFKNRLPVEVSIFSFQAGFLPTEVPPIDACLPIMSSNIVWEKFKDVHAPTHIKGVVYGNGGGNFEEAKIEVRSEFFEPESKQYRDAEKQWIETLGNYPVMKQFLEKESEPK
jgi:hypothetical protein